MAAKDFYYPHFISEHLEETAPLSLAARGALADFKTHCWNAATRGVLCEDLVGYARLFGCTAEQAERTIGELTRKGREVLLREELDGGMIRLTHAPTVHRASVSSVRSKSGKKGGKQSREVLLKQKSKQTSSKPLDLDLSLNGGCGGDGLEIGTDPDSGAELEDFDDWPLEKRVRHWLKVWPRFPLETTSPKDVSKVVELVERYGWPFVKECLTAALDNNAGRCVPYAETVAAKRAAKAFADKPAPVGRGAKVAGWRAG